MTNSNAPVIKPRTILKTLRKHALLWLIPTVFLGAGAYFYGRFMPPSWEATQALLLRDEGANNVKRHGRFDNLEAMKTAQKTVLELVRGKDALAMSLVELGPPEGYEQPDNWPTIKDIEQCRKNIALKPPKGAEFGSTEVVYLSVQEQTVERALKLADTVFAQLDKRMQTLRSDKARTTITELADAAGMAKKGLEQATAELETMETNIGADLADLRNLNKSASGEGNLQNSLQEIENELRQVRARNKSDSHLQLELRSAQKDPERLVAMPNSLLNSQPALRRLKEGLVDAQLRTAQLLGTMRKDHPAVMGALESEHEVQHHLHDELDVAIRGLATDLEVSGGRIRSLELQKLEYQTKLDRLARLRARYNNLVSEVQRRSEIVEKSEADLAEGRSALAAAQSGSLIKRLDKPRVGDEPLGPGLLLLTLSGLTAGLTAGLALVFLVAPFEEHGAPRWTGRLFGRRQSDGQPAERPDVGGRRMVDAQAAVAPRDKRAGASRAGDQPADNQRERETRRQPQAAKRRNSDTATNRRRENPTPPDAIESRQPVPAPTPTSPAPVEPKRRHQIQCPEQSPQDDTPLPNNTPLSNDTATQAETPQNIGRPDHPLPPVDRRSRPAAPLPDLPAEDLKRFGDDLHQQS